MKKKHEIQGSLELPSATAIPQSTTTEVQLYYGIPPSLVTFQRCQHMIAIRSSQQALKLTEGEIPDVIAFKPDGFFRIYQLPENYNALQICRALEIPEETMAAVYQYWFHSNHDTKTEPLFDNISSVRLKFKAGSSDQLQLEMIRENQLTVSHTERGDSSVLFATCGLDQDIIQITKHLQGNPNIVCAELNQTLGIRPQANTRQNSRHLTFFEALHCASQKQAFQLSLEKLSDTGLSRDDLRAWQQGPDVFDDLHVQALIFLADHEIYKANAIREINQLSLIQLRALIKFYNTGLRGEHLRSYQRDLTGTPFSAPHVFAISCLAERKKIGLEAIQEISGLTVAQVRHISLGKNRSQALQETSDPIVDEDQAARDWEWGKGMKLSLQVQEKLILQLPKDYEPGLAIPLESLKHHGN